jgi:dTDP-4-amino-4,6-dideoxygalactose transaminase
MNSSPALSPLTFMQSLTASRAETISGATYYSYARGALIAALHSIKISKQMVSYPRVWAPAFICDTVFFLLEHYQIEYSCYPVNDDLLPDWNYLERCTFSNNDVLLLVYYFGFPMGISAAKSFCQKNRLLLIEDCAHSITQEIKPDQIGTHGVAAIFGLRKIIPIPNGGFLYMKNTLLSPPPGVSNLPSIYRRPSKMVLQWLIDKLHFKPPGLWNKINKSSINTFERNYDLFNFQEAMSGWGKKILNVTDIDYVIQARKRNYEIYCRELSHLKQIRIPSTLLAHHQQATPWVFFFFFDKAEWLINKLRKRGIFAGDFPNLHPAIFGNPAYPKTNLMYQQSITLPVHQDLSQKKVRMIAHHVKQLLTCCGEEQSDASYAER